MGDLCHIAVRWTGVGTGEIRSLPLGRWRRRDFVPGKGVDHTHVTLWVIVVPPGAALAVFRWIKTKRAPTVPGKSPLRQSRRILELPGSPTC